MQVSIEFLDEVLNRHRTTWENTEVALDVLFSRLDRDELYEHECYAIGRSVYDLPVTIQLPSLEELIATGQLAIVGDVELRTALTRLEQLSDATQSIINHSNIVNLSAKYPNLISMEGYWSDQENEIRIRFQCDLVAMRADKGFLSDYSMNADGFDAFYNKGTRLELEELAHIHELIDRYLGIEHGEPAP
jgi:hypothetical protein